jgi:hypothetical protein
MNITNNVDSEEVGNAAQLLKKYVKDASIEPLISALEALKQDPSNESLLVQFKNTFQGAWYSSRRGFNLCALCHHLDI